MLQVKWRLIYFVLMHVLRLSSMVHQHLADANAYRRDRRKDALLQQNGYMVLRFLSEDVGKHLNDVLDSILRALTHHEERR